jgi:hypothetical protein
MISFGTTGGSKPCGSVLGMGMGDGVGAAGAGPDRDATTTATTAATLKDLVI